MNVRLYALGALIAALPVGIEVPAKPDSASARGGETRLEGAAGTGQFSLVTRGCEGEVLSELKDEIAGGGLALEHRFPQDWVVGVRGGTLREHPVSATGYGPVTLSGHVTTRYLNPWLAYEHRGVGLGAGWLDADQPFHLWGTDFFEPRFSGHLRLGDPELNVALRFMEEVPLDMGSYLLLQVGVRPRENLDFATGFGMLGPFDGAMLDLRGRFWLTPQAAVQLRSGFGSRGQYYVAAGATARLPDPAPRRRAAFETRRPPR